MTEPTPIRHWQTLADLNGAPEVQELREREFLTPSEEPTDIPSRRDFLKTAGVSGLAATVAGVSEAEAQVHELSLSLSNSSPRSTITFTSEVTA